jgi:hypothetical protein
MQCGQHHGEKCKKVMFRVEAEATRTLDLLELPFLESAALANLSYSPQPYSAGGYAVIPAIASEYEVQCASIIECQVQCSSFSLCCNVRQAGHTLVGSCTAQQAAVLQPPGACWTSCRFRWVRIAWLLLGIRALSWPGSRLSRHYHTKRTTTLSSRSCRPVSRTLLPCLSEGYSWWHFVPPPWPGICLSLSA